MVRFDIGQIKHLAIGRWPQLLNLAPELLDSRREHPCPKCGGNTRFRVLKDFAETGAVFCNKCFSRGNGDGIAAYAWLHDMTNGQAIAALGGILGAPQEVGAGKSGKSPHPGSKSPDPKKKSTKDGASSSTTSKPKQSAASQFEFSAWNDSIATMFAIRKRGIVAPSLVAVGARLGRHFGIPVIAIPIRNASGQTIGYTAANATGGKITIQYADGESEATSWKNVIDAKQKGICATTNLLVPAERSALTRIYKTEGPSDLLAIIPYLQPGEGAFCNPCGAGENPTNFPWLLEWLAGKQVIVIHDRDTAGVVGAIGDPERGRLGWATWAAQEATEVRNVELPYELVESKGADFRQWVMEGGTAEALGDLISRATVMEHSGIAIIESDDDPHRLARINMEGYMKSHGRRLVYWQSEWYRWKAGKYIKIEIDELKAKVSNAIRAEFERLWPSKLDAYNAWKMGERYNEATDKGPPPIQKITRNLVSNVIGAMEGMAAIPNSIKMPCWLPDRSEPHYVSMGNGILDLDKVCDGKPMEEFLLPHSHEWFSTFQLRYDYSKTAGCPKWLDYLDYVMEGDRDRIAILQEWAGYLLTPTNDYQQFMAFEGEGQNGKTVYFAAIIAMLGEENVSSVSLENFAGQFDLASTLGKAANISGDVDELDRVAEGVLKQFVGGDTMQFDRKNRQPISARPTAKLMCAWNKRPRFKDRSNGVWRRMLLIPFQRSVPADRRVFGMDNPNWWIENGEASGILRWAIVGLDRLRTNRAFTQSKVSQDALAEYKHDTNPAIEFLIDHCEASGDSQIECAWLYRLYSTWCVTNGVRALANNSFGKEVTKKFLGIERQRMSATDNPSRPWVYRGIKFSVDKVCDKYVYEVNL